MKKALLGLLFLGFAQTSFGMQPMTARAAISALKPLMKKGFAIGMTGLHWTIAAGTSIKQGFQKTQYCWDEEKSLTAEKYTNAQDDVNNFIMSALKENHNITIAGVKVEPHNPYAKPPFPTIGVLRRHVLINSSTATEISKALTDNNQEVIDKWLGTLDHEATHIKKEDILWRIAADLTLPFVTHSSIKIMRNVLPFAKKTRSFLGEQLIKIPTALGKDSITGVSRMTFYKYQEQRADNNIENDRNKLIGVKSHFYDLDQDRINSLKKIFTTLSDDTIRNIDSINNLLEPHPLPQKRIEKLDRRIAELEKTQKNESHS